MDIPGAVKDIDSAIALGVKPKAVALLKSAKAKLAEPAPTPPPEPQPNRIAYDRCLDDPVQVWGSLDAASPDRHQMFNSGGPIGSPFRRLTVKDGDDVYGERCEVGLNSLKMPTFQRYSEGERKITEMWFRLPSTFPIGTDRFQVLMQMKQTGNVGGTPVLALRAMRNEFHLINTRPDGSQQIVWRSAPVVGSWVRLTFDINYSSDVNKGSVSVNGLTPAITNTLWPGSIPSHLRAGIYHDPSIPGTSVDLGPTSVYAG